MKSGIAQPTHILSNVCHNVGIEPHLQPLNGESLDLRTANREEGAWLDIKAQGFYDTQCAFLDVRLINPSHCTVATYFRRKKWRALPENKRDRAWLFNKTSVYIFRCHGTGSQSDGQEAYDCHYTQQTLWPDDELDQMSPKLLCSKIGHNIMPMWFTLYLGTPSSSRKISKRTIFLALCEGRI